MANSTWFRHPAVVSRLLEKLHAAQTRPWVVMEICGGQTHALLRHGIDQLLPKNLNLVHGPGCPVCVTPISTIDQALAIARRPEVIFSTFGDMLRVPGSAATLSRIKAEGGDVRIVWSPLDALELARHHPERQVVFFAIGFETTAPNTALTVTLAARENLTNFSLLMAHVLVPPAVRALLAAPENRVQGFLAAGHVCAVTGWAPYESIAASFGVPFVVTGFEPVDLLRGILRLVELLEKGEPAVANAYERVVRREGNRAAQQQIDAVFQVCDRHWRGLGLIPGSGLALRPEYAAFDAGLKFPAAAPSANAEGICISGEILRGEKKPPDCPAFAQSCTPTSPLGATMVSSEGACAAYYAWRRTPG